MKRAVVAASVVLECVGAALLLYGLYLWSPALCYVAGGVWAVMLGQVFYSASTKVR